MIIQKYDSYKNLDIEFIGDIPHSWGVKRIKEVFWKFGSGSTPKAGNPNYYENANINWLNTTDLNNSEVYETKEKVTQKAVEDYSLQVYPINSMAMAMYGQGKTRGMVGILKIKTTTNQASCIMSNIKNGFQLRYILWNLISKYDVLRSINTGTTQPNMNQDFIRNSCLVIPSEKEQTQIYLFLDEKTSQIDSKIKLLQDKISSYEELKKTLISETVCRGLNKNVELKDSEIEWIGKIPKHWKKIRGKNIFSELPKSKISASEGEDNGKYKFFTSSVNQSKWLNTFNENSEEIIFSTGGIAGVHYCDQKFSYSTDCWALESNKEHLKYYYYYFKSIIYEIDTIGFKGAGLEHLQRDFITHNSLPNPPKSEQIQIAKYLDEKTSRIDKIISKIDDQITTLTEFRKTLINDVVTGKVRVVG